MAAVLRIENVSKAFRLGVFNRRVFFSDWRRRLTGHAEEVDTADPDVFWALRGVSFEVVQGEVVGLLGRNGAGKSTLLKIVSQITAPTEGRICIRGRVASLLEVGTGFHPELTGRDNIFINGAILGMTRREIASKFDEIVDFAGIETFIDTPVKRYSVGMRVRLAFAIAAQLETEILILDEVLAVGDAAFQQKCLGKVGAISKKGRTVLFVSHSAAAIEALCTRGIVLHEGRPVFDGTQTEAIEHYASQRAAGTTDLAARRDRGGSGEVRVRAIEVRGASGQPLAVARSGKAIAIALHFERARPLATLALAAELRVTTHLGAPVFYHATWLEGIEFSELPERGTLVVKIEDLPLPPGHYQIGYRLSTGGHRKSESIDAIEDAADLQVEAGDFFGSGKMPPAKSGVCLVRGSWKLEHAAPPEAVHP
jgi:lipopolysaccharide transport system ATP-binding protein